MPRISACFLLAAVLLATAAGGCGGGGGSSGASSSSGATAAAATGPFSGATAPASSAPGDEAARVPPRAAGSFVESIGVNVHLSYLDTPYADFATVARRLEELGVHHVRDNLMPDEPDEYRELNELAARGIFATLLLGSPENSLDGLAEQLSTIEEDLTGSVDALEGPNELDLTPGGTWPRELTEYQSALYEAVRSSPALADLPVIGPSLAWLRHAPEAPDLSAYLDYGNIHSYPGGEPPEWNLEAWLRAARIMSGSKPVIATESGYHTAIASQTDHAPVSEAAEAAYLPRLFLDYFAHGVVRTFAYELVDEHPDPARTEPESEFGLLRNDLSPKPAFTALENMISILEDPGPEFTPRKLGYTLSGNRSGLRQVLLQKRDGAYYLALWRDGSVWDAASREPVHPGSAPIEIHLDRGIASAAEFQPDVSGEPAAALPVRAGATSVRVGTRVVIVELRPG